MATKKKDPELKAEAEVKEEKAEEIIKETQEPAAAAEDQLAKKDAEIAKLKEMLKAAQQTQQAARKPFTGSKETDKERIHKLEEATAKAGGDPWTVETEVLVPHREKSEDPWYWLSVNGRTAQIPANDRYQTMKLPFACVLVDLLAYEKFSADYQDSLEVFDPVNNPHH